MLGVMVMVMVRKMIVVTVVGVILIMRLTCSARFSSASWSSPPTQYSLEETLHRSDQFSLKDQVCIIIPSQVIFDKTYPSPSLGRTGPWIDDNIRHHDYYLMAQLDNICHCSLRLYIDCVSLISTFLWLWSNTASDDLRSLSVFSPVVQIDVEAKKSEEGEDIIDIIKIALDFLAMYFVYSLTQHMTWLVVGKVQEYWTSLVQKSSLDHQAGCIIVLTLLVLPTNSPCFTREYMEI